MRYRLAVLTHGRMSTLEDTLAWFCERVTPKPEEIFVLADGPTRSTNAALTGVGGILRRTGKIADLREHRHPAGFCHATAELWRWAADGGDGSPDYVFWLEHDFLLRRDLDLRALATALEDRPKLAQMALCRDAANATEEAAGGLVASRPDAYTSAGDWLHHSAYFTTNPSLMRRAFMADHPWPDDNEPYCEGRFGIGLVEQGYSFGLWGGGEEWVQHVGIRTGFGY